jgi:hypothetical protein
MDRMQATPRIRPFVGGIADMLAAGSSPERTQQMQGLMRFLQVPDIAQTLDRISYGEPITTGAGMTTALRPEAKNTLGALLGLVPIGRAAEPAAVATGRALEPVAGRVAEAAYNRGGLAREMAMAMGQGTQSQAVRRVGQMEFDPRFDPRVKEQGKLRSLVTDVDESMVRVPEISITDLEGRPFITSMSDRTGVGLLQSIGDVNLNRPVNMQGGQDFMFNNPGMVWASGKNPSRQLLQEAEIIKQVTGQNPVYLPWRMAPSGGDFATMTGESMLSFADTNMTKGNKRKLDSKIKKMIPGWSGVSDPQSVEQFRGAPDAVRKSVKNMMDTEFRDMGGLSIGQARLSVADPRQLSAAEGGVMNVGEIFADRPLVTRSGHASYPFGVPGQGIGRLKEDVNVMQLMPNVVQARGIPDPMSPRQTDIRALQMKPYAGVITEGLLKQLGY